MPASTSSGHYAVSGKGRCVPILLQNYFGSQSAKSKIGPQHATLMQKSARLDSIVGRGAILVEFCSKICQFQT
jgi:hypothetical protein